MTVLEDAYENTREYTSEQMCILVSAVLLLNAKQINQSGFIFFWQ